jgi:phospholipid/cholesterol/gamma-HCH transport system substrate-binding protein
MNERVLQARVGIMVVSAILLTAILVLIFGKFPAMFTKGKTFYATFASAPGVLEGTPVRKSGILIGRVERVTFVEGSPKVLVTVRLNPDREVYDNEDVRVTASLLGDAVVEFVPREVPENPKPRPGGQTLEGKVVASPVELLSTLQPDIKDLLSNVGKAGNDVSKLAQNINKLVEGKDADRFEKVLTRTEKAMENFGVAMEKINKLIGDDQDVANLKQSLSTIPKIMEDTNKVVTGMQNAVNRADKNLENLEHLTGPLGERGEQIAARLDSSVAQLDQFMTQLVTITERFGNEEGSLTKIMNDPELYNQISSAARNINDLTGRMRPILEDVRVFTDTIARDPGRLGLSGALKRSPGTKYPNYGNVTPPPADWRLRPGEQVIEICEPGM